MADIKGLMGVYDDDNEAKERPASVGGRDQQAGSVPKEGGFCLRWRQPMGRGAERNVGMGETSHQEMDIESSEAKEVE